MLPKHKSNHHGQTQTANCCKDGDPTYDAVEEMRRVHTDKLAYDRQVGNVRFPDFFVIQRAWAVP